ncbi:50S ribosomal protein L7/L12 [candidate division WOR-3 bacterium]|uniref:Large ribosomal subunit protein bL12 n=1 Tax=candidate division WOR-3 bacterium TaxID=2052148 RepID=A0A660SIV6_UNCW3|nr:MAG: 50S ribosomal protein L7/L12 [candidate division WOR-3 bacterium]
MTPKKKSSVDDIIKAIEGLTVLELAELVKALEEKFGVSAQPVYQAPAPAGAPAEGEAKEEKTEFDISITATGDKKIQVLKALREITGLGLKEVKALIDNLPSKVKEGVAKEEAMEIKAKLEEAGATVELT